MFVVLLVVAHMTFRVAVALALLVLAVPAAAASQVYAADASMTPPNMAGFCLAFFHVQESKDPTGFRIGAEYSRVLSAAYRARVEEALKASGQTVSPEEAVRPIVEQLTAKWGDGFDAIQQARVCLTTADSGMVKARADAGLRDAMVCWSLRSAANYADPEVVLFEQDLEAAIRSFGVDGFIASLAMKRGTEEARAALAGPQGAALKSKMVDCFPSVRVGARRLAFAMTPWGAADEMWMPMLHLRWNLYQLSPLGSEGAKLAEEERWTLKPAAWKAWIDNEAAQIPIRCAVANPYRDANASANAMTYMDVAIRKMAEYGVSPLDTYILVASAGAQYERLSNENFPHEACKAVTKQSLEKAGSAFYEAKQPETPPANF